MIRPVPVLELRDCNNHKKTGDPFMDALIVFGPSPAKAATISALIAKGFQGTVFTGSTVNEVEKYGKPELFSSPVMKPCIIVFEHFVQGRHDQPCTDQQCAAWQSSFVTALNNPLSAAGFVKADMPQINIVFAKSTGEVSFTCIWPSFETSKCIEFCRALEGGVSPNPRNFPGPPCQSLERKYG
jgi:hypothetical protein